MMNRDNKKIVVLYTNWKGKTEKRTIIPWVAYWGSTEFHPEEQFLLKCYDVEKQAERTYAMKDIAKIESVENGIGAIDLFLNKK